MDATPNPSGLRSPYCARLRSKKLYLRSAPPQTPEDVLDASGFCWCERTAEALGPDAEPVDPEGCSAPRGCFEPLV